MFLVFLLLIGINIPALFLFANSGQGFSLTPFTLETFLPQLSLGHFGS
jgi:hypothetical protein